MVSLAKVAIKNDRANTCPIKSVIRVHLSGIGVRESNYKALHARARATKSPLRSR